MNFISGIFKSYITPVVNKPDDGLEYWQEKLILYLVMVVFLFVAVAYIPSVYLSIEVDLWSIAIIDTFVYALLILVFLRKDIHYRKKLYIILSISYVLGIILILSVGVYGAGYLWLFVVPVLAGALLNNKAAKLMLVVNIITIIALGFLQYFGFSLLIEIESFSLDSWLIICANFMFLSIIVTVTVIFIINGIQLTVEKEKQISNQLEITNKKLLKAKEDAEAADKLKTEFLAQISHEIRTPLNTIVNFSSIIAEESNKENQECCVSIEGAAKRIITTVEHLLNMSDIMTSAYEPKLRKLDIVERVIDLVIPEYVKLAKNKGLNFVTNNSAVNTKIYADEHAIGQIVTNLFDNAVKFTNRGKVELTLQNNNDHLEIIISDTGIGISEDHLDKIFYPFTQETTGYTREYDGIGLGLCLVKNYCDLNDIKLEITSQKGVGTTIKLIFRLADD
ncbi:MAG: hypothetical protein SCALA702_03990 [Melioribacteraceae bacterium]|nr:MAG: hypothetical protein SCALA702_03990 [Melioribacteraceae bacterium]